MNEKQAIVEKLRKLNPELMETHIKSSGTPGVRDGFCTYTNDPTLRHLLRAIPCEKYSNFHDGCFEGLDDNGNEFAIMYDLSKSLLQNLEASEELTDFVYQLLFNEE